MWFFKQHPALWIIEMIWFKISICLVNLNLVHTVDLVIDYWGDISIEYIQDMDLYNSSTPLPLWLSEGELATYTQYGFRLYCRFHTQIRFSVPLPLLEIWWKFTSNLIELLVILIIQGIHVAAEYFTYFSFLVVIIDYSTVVKIWQ